MSLAERDLNVLWHPYTQMKTMDLPVVISKGKGAWLYDEEGNAYLDGISSWWVNSHGHAHPHIAEKVAEQVKKLEHVIFAGFTHPGAVELAERLVGKLPDNQRHIFYSDNGSTAVEVALKMAIQYWDNKGSQRNTIISFENAYHGDTFGAMSVSGRGAFIKPFESMLFDVVFIEPPSAGKEEASLEQLREVLSTKGDSIAGFIYEPLVQGAAGMMMHTVHGLEQLILECQRNEILCIADEVMTGFGRTGKFFASDHLSIRPDIVCMSKGITGGTMALGATSCSSAIYEAFLSDDKSKTLFHGHSYTGNPVACAAANASMDLFDEDATWANIKRIVERHEQFAEKLQSLDGIENIRQVGTILAFDLQTGEETSYFNQDRDRIYKFFMDKKILLRPLGNVIYILPPLCITDSELDLIYNAIEALIGELNG
ncbi:MAG: adenosylmethionine--8-amino-7-oxononanoate transaminase [Flavobacteriales bacterium]|nr:adenosylmethionine--8-amino-7-oxononanoate transaminase [Flavobacteriales bacterium]